MLLFFRARTSSTPAAPAVVLWTAVIITTPQIAEVRIVTEPEP